MSGILFAFAALRDVRAPVTSIALRLAPYPDIRYTGGPDPPNLNNDGNLRYHTGLSDMWDTVWSAHFDARKTCATRLPFELKVGVVATGPQRDFNNKAARRPNTKTPRAANTTGR